MTTLRMPISGLMLVAHLAAYGVGVALDSAGQRAFLGYDPDSLELEPHIETNATADRIAECVRQTTLDCEPIVQADLVPGCPVLWARFTDDQRGPVALQRRETLLDEAEVTRWALAPRLAAGLGAPAAWLTKGKSSWGASQLDGVAGNSTSDFVRGVLRRTLPVARDATAAQLETLWLASDPPSPEAPDKTGWAPPGVRVHPLHQWLAAIGLTQLPVALAAAERSRTPCFWRRGQRRGARLPVSRAPISMPRLRALLQSPELTASELTQAGQARLRALGVEGVLEFPLIDQTTGNMVQFAFGRARWIELT